MLSEHAEHVLGRLAGRLLQGLPSGVRGVSRGARAADLGPPRKELEPDHDDVGRANHPRLGASTTSAICVHHTTISPNTVPSHCTNGVAAWPCGLSRITDQPARRLRAVQSWTGS